MVQFATLLQLELLGGHILSHSCEVGIDKRIRVSLTTLAAEAAMVEASGLKHLPDRRITPVVRFLLRPDADIEIVVASIQMSGHCPVCIPVKQYHILLELLEGLIKSLLIVFAFTLAIADGASTISNEDEYTTMVNSIQPCHIADTI